MQSNNRVPYIIVVGVLLVGCVFFGLNYFFLSQELEEVQSRSAKTELNERVLGFTSLFITEVLQADGEVNFETRLSLENSVRGLKDEQIMAEWQKFVGSKTEAEAQASVKRLLGMLIDKVQR
ncbi:MAG: hypothetical protein WAV15_01305 [Minisyncoccia bacterium]